MIDIKPGRTINVLVYALPNRSSGGLSVIENLYIDILKHEEIGKFEDIRWFFVVGTGGFESTRSVTIINEAHALKSWFHRLYYSKVKAKKIIKENGIDLIFSLNMNSLGGELPSIISLHNVLPLYQIDHTVFDSYFWIVKQKTINKLILKSLRRADAILVPGMWLKEALVEKLEINGEKIIPTEIPVPEIAREDYQKSEKWGENGELVFVYPATGFLYKNHKAIIEAVKIMKRKGVSGYQVIFAGYTGGGKTAREYEDEILKEDLPIRFSEVLPKNELASLYHNGILVFPSKIETDAFPILESMMCGGEMIVADLPYAREPLEKYDRVTFFDPDDYGGLSDIMIKAVGNSMRVEGDVVSVAKTVVPRSEVIVPLIRKVILRRAGKQK